MLLKLSSWWVRSASQRQGEHARGPRVASDAVRFPHPTGWVCCQSVASRQAIRDGSVSQWLEHRTGVQETWTLCPALEVVSACRRWGLCTVSGQLPANLHFCTGGNQTNYEMKGDVLDLLTQCLGWDSTALKFGAFDKGNSSLKG